VAVIEDASAYAERMRPNEALLGGFSEPGNCFAVVLRYPIASETRRTKLQASRTESLNR
jgi:hypothetical protein